MAEKMENKNIKENLQGKDLQVQNPDFEASLGSGDTGYSTAISEGGMSSSVSSTASQGNASVNPEQIGRRIIIDNPIDGPKPGKTTGNQHINENASVNPEQIGKGIIIDNPIDGPKPGKTTGNQLDQVDSMRFWDSMETVFEQGNLSSDMASAFMENPGALLDSIAAKGNSQALIEAVSNIKDALAFADMNTLGTLASFMFGTQAQMVGPTPYINPVAVWAARKMAIQLIKKYCLKGIFPVLLLAIVETPAKMTSILPILGDWIEGNITWEEAKKRIKDEVTGAVDQVEEIIEAIEDGLGLGGGDGEGGTPGTPGDGGGGYTGTSNGGGFTGIGNGGGGGNPDDGGGGYTGSNNGGGYTGVGNGGGDSGGNPEPNDGGGGYTGNSNGGGYTGNSNGGTLGGNDENGKPTSGDAFAGTSSFGGGAGGKVDIVQGGGKGRGELVAGIIGAAQVGQGGSYPGLGQGNPSITNPGQGGGFPGGGQGGGFPGGGQGGSFPGGGQGGGYPGLGQGNPSITNPGQGNLGNANIPGNMGNYTGPGNHQIPGADRFPGGAVPGNIGNYGTTPGNHQIPGADHFPGGTVPGNIGNYGTTPGNHQIPGQDHINPDPGNISMPGLNEPRPDVGKLNPDLGQANRPNIEHIERPELMNPNIPPKLDNNWKENLENGKEIYPGEEDNTEGGEADDGAATLEGVKRKRRRKRRWPIIAGVIAGVAVIGGLIIGLPSRFPKQPEEHVHTWEETDDWSGVTQIPAINAPMTLYVCTGCGEKWIDIEHPEGGGLPDLGDYEPGEDGGFAPAPEEQNHEHSWDESDDWSLVGGRVPSKHAKHTLYVCAECGATWIKSEPWEDTGDTAPLGGYANEGNDSEPGMPVGAMPGNNSICTEHTWKLSDTAEGTCQEEGYELYICENCEEEKKELLKKGDHSYKLTDKTAASCVAKGYELYTCEYCKQTKKTESAMIDHVWKLTDSKAMTCTANGYEVYTCSGCGSATRNDIVSTGHKWYQKEYVEPGCNTDGRDVKACANCNVTDYTTISSTGHSWYQSGYSAPSCTSDGSETYTCTRCQETYSNSIGSTGHSWYQSAHVDPSCGVEGYDEQTCGNCGATQRTSLGTLWHDWDWNYSDYQEKCRNCGALKDKIN